MKIKKYEVTDMKEALRQIKQDLGPDAVILTTRKIMKPSGLGLFPRPVLEVTAAVEYDKGAANTAASQRSAETTAAKAQPRSTPTAAAKPAAKATPPAPPRAPMPPASSQSAVYSRSGTPPVTQQRAPAPIDPLLDIEDDDEYLRSLVESTRDYRQTVSAKASAAKPASNVYSELDDYEEDFKEPPQKHEEAEENHVINEFSGVSANKLSDILGSLGLDKISTLVDDIGEIKKQLTAMKSTLAEPTANIGVDLPNNLKEYYSLLIKNGMDELLCYRFLKSIERKLPEMPGKAVTRNIIQQELAEQIPVEKDFVTALYKKVAAFMGPTGVGKTTTIAKVAAHLVLRYTQRVCLITADNFRIGAVDQLKTYADIVNLPLFVASSPEELKRLLVDIQSSYDYIILDTTGRSPYDNSKLNDIASYLSVSEDIVPIVVMSLAGNQMEQSDMFERYTALDPAYLIFTKLDETRYYGPLANIPMKKKIPLMLLSTGQGVPDDLEIPDGKKIAKKLLSEIPELWKEN